jgi:hypothetical protein
MIHSFHHLLLHNSFAIATLLRIFTWSKAYAVRIHIFSAIHWKHLIKLFCTLQVLKLSLISPLVYCLSVMDLRLAVAMVDAASHGWLRFLRMLIWRAVRCHCGAWLETTLLIWIMIALTDLVSLWKLSCLDKFILDLKELFLIVLFALPQLIFEILRLGTLLCHLIILWLSSFDELFDLFL